MKRKVLSSSPGLFNVQKAAEFLGVSPGTIRRWAQNKHLDGMQVGNRGDWRFTEGELLKMVKKPSDKASLNKKRQVTSHHEHFIIGSGEMADRIRRFDWSKTSIGPLASWPHSLLTTVNTILQSPVPMVMLWGQDGIMIYNDAYSVFAGRRHPSLLGSKVLEGWPEVAEFNQNVMKYGLAGKTLSYKDHTLTLYRNNVPEEVSMDLNYSSIIDESGKPAGVLAIVVETTKRVLAEHKQKQAEKILKESEERFRTLIEQSADAIQLVTPEGTILYTSDSIVNVLGYTPEELQGKRAQPFIHPDDLPLFKKKFHQLLKSPKKHVVLQYRCKHKDGSWAWLETTGVNHLNTPNINAIVGNFRNITEHKNAEEALQSERLRLREVFKQAPAAIAVVHGSEQRYEFANDFYQRLFNRSEKQLLGRSIREVFPEIKGQGIYELFDAVFKTGKPFVSDEFPVLFDRAGNGTSEQGYFSFIAQPIKEGKKVERVLIHAVEVTEQVQARKHIEELSRQKDEFIGIASHELKTPVTSIKGYTQVLHRRFLKIGDDNSATLLTKMDAQLNKLTSLIADLLDVTRMDTGKIQFHEEFFDFNELASEIIEEMQHTTDKHTIMKKLGKTKIIYGDRDRIGQVLTNLLSNAIKYSPHTDKIIVKSTTDKERITLCVEDFGVGISKEKQEKVFERFFRVSGPKQDTFPGMGLGLYISSEIVKRQGGRIWVESSKGKGSTFCFTLPIKKQKKND